MLLKFAIWAELRIYLLDYLGFLLNTVFKYFVVVFQSLDLLSKVCVFSFDGLKIVRLLKLGQKCGNLRCRLVQKCLGSIQFGLQVVSLLSNLSVFDMLQSHEFFDL